MRPLRYFFGILGFMLFCALLYLALKAEVLARGDDNSKWNKCSNIDNKKYDQCLIEYQDYYLSQTIVAQKSRRYFLQYYYSGDFMWPERKREVFQVSKAIGHFVDIQYYAIESYNLLIGNDNYYLAWRLALYENFSFEMKSDAFYGWLNQAVYNLYFG